MKSGVFETMTIRQGAKTILVVEDREPVRLFVSTALQRSGYLTLVAASGEEAIQAARCYRGPIELLLSDLQMPGMSGIEVGRKIVGGRPEMRMLIMTGADLSVVRVDRGWRLLEKPFTAGQLLEAVASILRDDRAIVHHA